MILARRSTVANFRNAEEYLDKTIYKVYPYRYAIGFLFILSSYANLFQWFEFNPILTKTARIYNLSLNTVTSGILLISNILYLPAIMVSSWIFDQYGIRISMLFGAFATMTGAWLRALCGDGFLWIFLGSCVTSFGQPFFYASAQKISSVWFRAEDRTLATTFMLAVQSTGGAVGALLPRFFFDPKVSDEQSLDELISLMLFTAYFATFCFVMVLIFWRESPPTAPSRSAVKQKYNYKESTKRMFKNKNLMICMVAISLFTGILNTIGTIVQPILEIFGLNTNEVGVLISIIVFITMGMSFLIGYLVAKTQKYKIWNILFCCLSLLSLLTLGLVGSTANTTIIFILSLLIMAFGGGSYPALFEFLVELSFPIAEDVTGNLYTLAYQYISTGLAEIMLYMIRENTVAEAIETIYFSLALGVVSMTIFLFVKEDLKRSIYERDGSQALIQKVEIENRKTTYVGSM